MPDKTAGPIVSEVDIEAAPDTVFDFFVDPDKLTRWLASEATLDPRAGGVCLQTHPGDAGAGPFHMRGEFVEVDRPRRVVFTWGFAEPEVGVPVGSTTVEVTLHPRGSGTRVELVHRALPAAQRADHDTGWAGMLDRLRAAVVADAAGAVTIAHEV
jgi:uncharacterized protein YndB with AHSA1/START domain